MADSKKNTVTQQPVQHITKKCPYCLTYLKLGDEKCYSCGAKVGKVDKLGFAQKPFNWKGYTISIIAWIAFLVYLWWAFFQNK